VDEVAPAVVLDADKDTPDGWVARSEELIRLTGALAVRRAPSRNAHSDATKKKA
jgi:hypothetical protein